MSRTPTESAQVSPATSQSLTRALLSVAAAAARDHVEAFKDEVENAYRCGASETAIVGAYADGGLHRLDHGLSVISFGWTGEPH